MNNDKLMDDFIFAKAKVEKDYVPKNLIKKIDDTTKKLDNRKITRRFILKRLTLVASLTLIIITSLSVAFPAYARSMPIVSSVFQFLSERNLIDEEYVRYSSTVNLAKTSNGVTITINSIATDGIELLIGYTIESDKPFKFVPGLFDKIIEVDGKKVGWGSGGGGQKINDKLYVGTESYNMSTDYLPIDIKKSILGGDLNLPNFFNLELDIRSIGKEINGDWDFMFKVSSEDIKVNTQVKKITEDLGSVLPDLKVNEVIFSPLNTVIRSSRKSPIKEDYPFFFVYDDKGRALFHKGSEGNGASKSSYYENSFQNVYGDTQYITIIPALYSNYYKEYMKKNPGLSSFDSKEENINFNGETILSEGRIGEYKITKVDEEKDKTIIDYECNSLLSAMEPYGLFLKDENGKTYDITKDKVKSIGINKYRAEIEPLNKNASYKLCSSDIEKMYDVKDEFKFTVSVK